MANPSFLTVVPIVPDEATSLGPPDIIDTTGVVPVPGPDTREMPEYVVFEVKASAPGQRMTILASDWEYAVRRSLGDLVFELGPTMATLETALPGDDNDVVFTAVNWGLSGNDISITYLDPGAPGVPLSVDVVDSDITITLATEDITGDILTTADDVVTAITTDAAASALVTAELADGNDGTGVVTEMSATFLSGGTDDCTLLGPFESARFEQADGDMDIEFTVTAGEQIQVRAYLMP